MTTIIEEKNLLQVNGDIARYENQYGMDSIAFWKQYQRGKLDDTSDFMEWYVLCKSRQRIEERLAVLVIK